MSWKLSDTFLLRRAGFPFDLLDGFAATDLARLALRWADVTEEAERRRRTLLSELFPAAVERARKREDRAALRDLSALRRSVGRRRVRPAPPGLDDDELTRAHRAWAEQVDRAARLAAEAARAVAPAWESAARGLRELAEREDISDALLQLSPDFHEATTRHLADDRRADAASRAHDRRLWSYLQRLAAKNETTSAFGPVTFGSFGAVDAPEAGAELPDGVRERVAFVSFWAAVAIGRAATRGATVRNLVPARRLPAVHLTGDLATLPGRPPVPLSETELSVLHACDGTRDAQGIADATRLDIAATRTALAALERSALIQRRCEPCSTHLDPLRDVLDQLPDTPELRAFTAAAKEFADLVAAFATSPPDARRAALRRAERAFETLTGAPARRNAGGTYADRLVLFEDCHGDGQPLTLPERLRQRIQHELRPVLDFGLTVGQRVRTAHRQLATELLAETGELPFLEFAARLTRAVEEGRLRPALAPVERLHDAYRTLVTDASDGRTARLDPDRLTALGRPDDTPAFVSPDLLLTGARHGEGPLVLGEIHPYVFGWGLQGGFAPDPEALRQELAGLLPAWGGPDRLATVLHRRRHKGLITNRFPGTFIEVTGTARSAPRRVPINALRAALRDGEPTLLGPDGPLELYVGEADHPHLRVFAPAQVEVARLTLGERTPRIVIGDVVVQRAAWRPGDAHRDALVAATTDQLPLAVASLRRALGLPRHLFSLGTGEIKPLYLDLDGVHSQYALRQQAEHGPLSLVEMLPAPDQLWLRRSTGAFTSELRLSMSRVPGGRT
ncbi:lantibiotic dehydratase [Streptomyces buecherae]|uniref:lantibiotic dehydratase n=1 Tax=Streptomyces buecherae TaxID=2763006 RepID=UPI00367AAC1C